MKKEIMATYYHISPTREEPNHGNCPTEAKIWCKWQKAIASKKDPKLNDLTPLLGDEIKQHLLPINKDLSRDDLLERYLGNHTQNSNESFNATVW